MYLWICEVLIKSILVMTSYSSDTINRAFKLFGKVIANNLNESKIMIGGENVFVQLYESKFGKRKYQRGHKVEGVWVFGGVEITDDRKMFAVTVDKRDSETLNEIILEHGLPGSIVITDGLKGYTSLKIIRIFSIIG